MTDNSVKCRYKDTCKSYPHMCNTCANNENRDYYTPVNPPYVPIYPPYNPWYPWYPDIIWQPKECYYCRCE